MTRETIEKFTCSTNFEAMTGGQNESVRVGELVLKPVYEPRKYLWLSECLEQVKAEDVSIAKPIKSREGNYIENGIGATRYYEAKFFEDKIDAKLDTCRKLNEITSNISKPDDFDLWESPWTKAQNLAWIIPGNFNVKIPGEIQRLMSLREEIEIPSQLVHVDLAGNILFDAKENAVIIDFTPGFYPKEYAEMLLLIDSIAWYKASIGSLDLLNVQGKIRRQLMLRSLIFRLSVPLFFNDSDDGINYQRNLYGYKPLLAEL
jgi:uncharacterized protein (TIGR02569 family)